MARPHQPETELDSSLTLSVSGLGCLVFVFPAYAHALSRRPCSDTASMGERESDIARWQRERVAMASGRDGLNKSLLLMRVGSDKALKRQYQILTWAARVWRVVDFTGAG